MDESLKQDIHKAISDSGFPLENYVDVVLRKHGWQTITNRHYIDDVEGKERELDILAYKGYADKKENIEYITALIVSCKKNSVNKWCFLTRDANPKDVNTDWTPYHYCTNDKVLSFMTKNHREIIIDKYLSNRAVKHLYSFDERVFAYQVLTESVTTKGKGKDKVVNRQWIFTENKSLHDSIITSIKALDMEKRSLIEQHIGRPYNRYYTFHILSIYDGNMVKSHLDDEGNIESEEINHINYLNRHIVNKVDDFYIVNFINKDNFDYRLRIFDYLHLENKRTLPKLITEFYTNIFEDEKKVQVLWSDFTHSIIWYLKGCLFEINRNYLSENVNLFHLYKKDENILRLCIERPFITSEELQLLNENKRLKDFIHRNLMRIFRYDGDFIFTEGLPF